MNNLYILKETFTNGYMPEIIDMFSIISILCGILVIISKNPIVSVLFLIGLFLSIASYLITIGLSFIGLSYLLVYVGAVSILFLFILMLINVRISELLSETSNSIPLALIVSICFVYVVYHILPYSMLGFNGYIATIINKLFNNSSYNNIYLNGNLSIFDNKEEISFITSNSWDGNIAEFSHISSIGNIMYTNYSIWLIITSLILLLAMVGAIIITIKQKA